MSRYLRFNNRKLYDTVFSIYVSSQEVIAAIRSGLDVSVTCKRTGKDITGEVILVALAKERHPASALLDFIKNNKPPEETNRWAGVVCSVKKCRHEVVTRGLCRDHFRLMFVGKDILPFLEKAA